MEALQNSAVTGEAAGAIRGAAFIGLLDQMSDSICLVMDAAELCRSTQPIANGKVTQ